MKDFYLLCCYTRICKKDRNAENQVINIACGERTTINELFEILKERAGSDLIPSYRSERQGDVKHSHADISKAKEYLNYEPKYDVRRGLKKVFLWYSQEFEKSNR